MSAMMSRIKRWVYWRVVHLNDRTDGRYIWLQRRLWYSGWGD